MYYFTSQLPVWVANEFVICTIYVHSQSQATPRLLCDLSVGIDTYCHVLEKIPTVFPCTVLAKSRSVEGS